MRYDNLILRLVLICFIATRAALGQGMSQLKERTRLSASEKIHMIFTSQSIRSSLAPTTICQNKNPFIKHLFDRGVDLYPEPTNAPHLVKRSCPTEWPKFGSCCDRTSLLEYAKKDQSDIMTAASIVEKKFREFTTAIRPLYDVIVLLSAIKNDNVFVGLVRNIMRRFDSKNLYYFTHLMQNKNLVADFQRDNRKCWTKIVAVRKSALCQTCSGRSQEFFEGKKIKISEHTCTDILSFCASTFEQIANLLKILGILAEDIKVSGILEQTGANFEGLKLISELSASIKEQHLTRKAGEFTAAIQAKKQAESFEKVAERLQATGDKQNFESRKKEIEKKLLGLTQSSYLCDRFLRLSKLPFIWDIANHFDIDVEVFKQATLLYQHASEKIQVWKSTQTSKWTLGSRLLLCSPKSAVAQSTTPQAFISNFAGDVKTIKKPSAFVLNIMDMP